MKKANIVSAIIGMMLSVYAFCVTLTFRQFKNVPVGPEVFPRWLCLGLFVCCAILLFQSLRLDAKENPSPSISPKRKAIQRTLVGLGIIIVYALAWETLGFILGSLICLSAMMYVFGLRNWRMMIVAAVASTAAIYCVFRFFLNISMPLGVFENFM
jgi:putative tricarboxylic transport membrane protein